MKNSRKKVMVLNNISSPYISEAIIFLKDYDPRLDTGAVREAERIINEYMEKRAPKRQSNALKYVCAALLMCACFAAGYLLNR